MTTRTGLRWAIVMLGVLIAVYVARRGDVSAAPRIGFVDNGDGTITDTRTGLMWEKKTGTFGNPDYTDPTDVNNGYTWSYTVNAPDGTLFTDFLPRMNCSVSEWGTCPAGGKYRDWRIPTVRELQTTLVPGCLIGTDSCIDPVLGVTGLGNDWSSTWSSDFPGEVYVMDARDGLVGSLVGQYYGHVRAVRGGIR